MSANNITSPSVLIVEDEPAIRELLAVNLKHAGYLVLQASDTRMAQMQLDATLPDILLLDWMLPDQSGVDFAKKLRASLRTRDIPIIMLTARAEETDKLTGFESGADDYITKPFSPKELMARMKALLRRRSPASVDDPIEFVGLRIEPDTRRTLAHGQPLSLSPTEFKLLHYLMKHPDKVVSRSKLLDNVWGNEVYIEERTVDVHIRRLRIALEPTGHDLQIETVRGGGYRFFPIKKTTPDN
jgi:two-component system, OmpR family, phosphate regulon response regulator PhoB